MMFENKRIKFSDLALIGNQFCEPINSNIFINEFKNRFLGMNYVSKIKIDDYYIYYDILNDKTYKFLYRIQKDEYEKFEFLCKKPIVWFKKNVLPKKESVDIFYIEKKSRFLIYRTFLVTCVISKGVNVEFDIKEYCRFFIDLKKEIPLFYTFHGTSCYNQLKLQGDFLKINKLIYYPRVFIYSDSNFIISDELFHSYDFIKCYGKKNLYKNDNLTKCISYLLMLNDSSSRKVLNYLPMLFDYGLLKYKDFANYFFIIDNIDYINKKSVLYLKKYYVDSNYNKIDVVKLFNLFSYLNFFKKYNFNWDSKDIDLICIQKLGSIDEFDELKAYLNEYNTLYKYNYKFMNIVNYLCKYNISVSEYLLYLHDIIAYKDLVDDVLIHDLMPMDFKSVSSDLKYLLFSFNDINTSLALSFVSKYYSSLNGSYNNLDIVVPNNIQMIQEQAVKLNQCLVTKKFADKMIKGELILLFVHDNSTGLDYTCSINFDNEIIEFRGCQHGDYNEDHFKSVADESLFEALRLYLFDKHVVYHPYHPIYFKGFKSGLKSFNDFKFEVGKTYKTDCKSSDLIINGVKSLGTKDLFHFCDDPKKITSWIDSDEYALIEPLGPIVSDGSRCGSNSIKIIKVISKDELFNFGKGCVNND